jgi:ribosomal-protein-alanine N-acetyltransferase
MSPLDLPPRFPFDDPTVPFYVTLMQVSDLSQVMDIERRAFPSPWPASAYRYEMAQNDLSTYLVLKLRQSRRTRGGGRTPPLQSGRRTSPLRSGGMTPPLRSGGRSLPLRLGRMGLSLRRQIREPVLGYGGFWLMVDEAHISTIAVHPMWRGRGLGEMALVAMIEAAILRGAAEVTLEVRVSNGVAQSLYRKYAFVQVGRRKGYYQDNGEDALIMTTPRVDRTEFVERYKGLKVDLRQKLARHLEQPSAG